MTEGIIIALIGSGLSLVGVIITVVVGNKKSEKRQKASDDKSEEHNKIVLYRIMELERKQDKYNHLQERVAKMECHDAAVDAKITDMRDDIKYIKKAISEK